MSYPKKTFEDTYNQYIDKIYRFIFLKVDSKEKAEDLCSETFSRYWQQLKQGLKIENPSAFLYRIARNLIIDNYREKARVQLVSVENSNIIDPSLDLEEKAMLASDVNMVKASLANLKGDYQNIIIWRYLDELSISEIAEMLGKTEGTVSVMLHRALKTLKNELKDV